MHLLNIALYSVWQPCILPRVHIGYAKFFGTNSLEAWNQEIISFSRKTGMSILSGLMVLNLFGVRTLLYSHLSFLPSIVFNDQVSFFVFFLNSCFIVMYLCFYFDK